MKLSLPRKWRRQTPIFMVGAALFLFGVLGFVYEAWQSRASQFERLLSDQVVFAVQLSTEALSSLDESQLDLVQPDWLNLSNFTTEGLSPWLGSEVGLAALDDKHFVVAARYRSRKALETWLEAQLTLDESFTITDTEGGEIWSPQFSSQQVFLLSDDWVFVADSPSTLQAALSNGSDLVDQPLYRQAFAEVVSHQDARLYVNTEAFFGTWVAPENLAVYKPMLTALGQTFPSLALTMGNKENRREFSTQWVLANDLTGVMQAEQTGKNTTIPDLAHYAPNDVLFFINGQNLFTRYQNTKALLAELNPQFGLVFDGLLRAQMRRWFGAEIDLEKDVLSYVQGPYAMVLDQRTDGLHWLVVVKAEVGNDLEALIRRAQGQFAPQIEVVELPDGTNREELVATPPENVQIREVERRGWTYFEAQNSQVGQSNLVFVQQGSHFLLASDSDLLEAALEAQKNDTTSLASNNDFRQAVLYRLGQAESFGFVNMDKVRQLSLPLVTLPVYEVDGELQEPELSWWQQILTTSIRNVVFSRRLDEGAVQVRGVVF